MIIFDIIVVLLSLTMMLIVVPKIMKRHKKNKTSECSGCKTNLHEYATLAITSDEMDKAMEAHRRGMCEPCKIQNDREEQLKEVFTPGVLSTIKRKIKKILNYKYTATIFFFSSAFFGIIPVSGTILVIFKSIQVSLLGLGWVILMMSIKK